MSLPNLDTSCMVIIDGLPALNSPNDFLTIANNLEQGAAEIARSNIKPIVHVPTQKTGDDHDVSINVFGFAFIGFSSSDDANKFIDQWHKSKYLMNYQLQVYPWTTFEESSKLSDEYPKISKQEFQDSRNLLWWLQDKEGIESYRDQYVVRYLENDRHETNIYWHDILVAKSGRVLCYDGQNEKEKRTVMTTSFVQWSPKGSYLATFHTRGIRLWGGPRWLQLYRFEHQYVDFIDFSPDENYLITFNSIGHNIKNPNGQDEYLEPRIIIWNILSGQMQRDFTGDNIGPSIKMRHSGWWPIFKWSYNDKYFAKIDSSKKSKAKTKDIDKISIHDSETMLKLDKKSYHAPNTFDISFSPNDNILAYSTKAMENDSAKIILLQLPSKYEIKKQTLGFDVVQAHLYWQPEGKYLAIKIGHLISKKLSYSIGIIGIKTRDMPYTFTEKMGKIIYFSWEYNHPKFGVIHGNILKPTVSFFQVKDNGNIKELFKLNDRKCNSLYFSPMGNHCVISFIDPKGGATLEFVNLLKLGNETVAQKHTSCKEIHWDPSGQYLITCATQPLNTTTQGSDTGYIIWSYQGEKLFEHRITNFYQILWRPRPKPFLNEEQKSEARKLLPEYSKIFEEHDEKIRRRYQSKYIQENLKKLEDFNALQESYKKKLSEFHKTRNQLRDGYSSEGEDNDYEITEVQEEITINYKEQKISPITLKKIMAGQDIDFDKYNDDDIDEKQSISIQQSKSTSLRPTR